MPLQRRSIATLRDDVHAIWTAGVRAVDSRQLVMESLELVGDTLRIVDESIQLDSIRRIIVVGAGKAGAGMARGVLDVLGDAVVGEKQLRGWLNVPADCVRPCDPITLHAARPAGLNEPTEAGVEGTQAILRLLDESTESDLILCLLSGGGSALLPAPIEGVPLQDKQAITRLLSGAGANIDQLNTVRKQLSQVKGGRLAKRSHGCLRSLIISDVIGDPLDVIASGPTVLDSKTAVDALRVLDDLRLTDSAPDSVLRSLRSRLNFETKSDLGDVRNHIIGNNAVAVDAAGIEAERLGYSHAMIAATQLEGAAEDVGAHLAKMAIRMRNQPGPDCLISGGEPTVSLVPEAERGAGGRNQQLVLAAAQVLLEQNERRGIAILAGGTDGEDGPTDAAGGFVDEQRLLSLSIDSVADALARNDAYSLLEKVDALIKTGPTHTNVCDVRVVVVDRVNARDDGAGDAPSEP